MALLPDRESLGARPLPASRRGVAVNPHAGAVGAAAAGVGEALSRAAEEEFEKQDRLAGAAARAELLKADVAFRRELQNDNDYATFESRYTEHMTKARESAARMIGGRHARAMFEQESSLDFERGRAEVLTAARGREIGAKSATLHQTLDTLADTSREALDDGTRTASITTANEAITAGEKAGIIDPVDAVKLRESWAGRVATSWTVGAIRRGDLAGAQQVLAKFGDYIDGSVRDELEGQLKGLVDAREDDDILNEFMGAASEGEGSMVTIGDPMRGKGRRPVPPGEFGAPRDYGAHQGVDYPAPRGTPVHSTGWGTATVSTSEKGGNIVTVSLANGETWNFMHLDAVKVKDGDVVTPDTIVGTVGTTGRSSGPHLHVEVLKDGKLLNASKVIGRARQSPQRHDLAQILAQIDARADAENWTPERRERVKQRAELRVERDERLLARQEADRWRAALDIVEKLGPRFTNPAAQLHNFDDYTPAQRLELKEIAERNRQTRRGATVTPHSDRAVDLKLLAARDPQTFEKRDLRADKPYLTAAEYNALADDQARMARERRESGGKSSPTATLRSDIHRAIAFHGRSIGLGIADRATAQQREVFSRIEDMMRGFVQRLTQGKRAATEDELKAAFDSATQEQFITREEAGFFGLSTRKVKIRRFEARPGEERRALTRLPRPAVRRILGMFQSVDMPNPTWQQVNDAYWLGKGEGRW